MAPRADWHHITVNVDPEVTQELVDTAVGLGISQVFVVKARGVLRREKWGPFTLPAISPLFDILHILVPQDRLDAVLEALVRAGDLDRFGAGSIWATGIDEFWQRDAALVEANVACPDAVGEVEFQRDLVAIQAICQLEHAEEIAHAAMEAGSHAPTICYGYGHGIRDRLGFFLQLTINPKKEFIDLVIAADEAEAVFAAMVEEGHLDKPAQGFISTRPVQIGLINTMSYRARSPYPATMEQIIRAIDQLQGNTNWRRTEASREHRLPSRKLLRNLVSVTCIVPRGLGDQCSLAAMEAGAGGTSTFFANAVPVAHPKVPHEGTDEREILSLTVGHDLVEGIVQALLALPELDGQPLVFFAHPAPLSVTYVP